MIEYLKKKICEGKKVFIFGIGEIGTRVSECLSMAGVLYSGFFDNSLPQGGVYKQKVVYPLSFLSNGQQEDFIVIIAVADQADIIKQLDGLKLFEIINYGLLPSTHYNNFPKLSFNVSEDPFVTIVITAFNSWLSTYECMKSLHDNDIQYKYEIIFVDDKSIDEVRNADNYFENIRIIHNDENLGYLRAINKGVGLANKKSKYIILLQNDIILTKKGTINKMIDKMESDSIIGALTGKYWHPNDNMWYTAGIYNSGSIDAKLISPVSPETEVDYLMPALIAIRKKLWDIIGGYDEAFLPTYYDDNDFCLNVIENGFKCVYFPEIECVHYHDLGYAQERRKGDLERIFKNNGEKFYKKHRKYLDK